MRHHRMGTTLTAGLLRQRVWIPQTETTGGSQRHSRLVSKLRAYHATTPRKSVIFDPQSIINGERNPPPDEPRIAIIGGGITGLTTAYYLAQLLPSAKLTLYEAGSRLGGWVRSEQVEMDTFSGKRKILFERGPRSLSPGDAIHDQQDRLILYDILMDNAIPSAVPPPNLARYMYYPDRLVPMPPQNTLLNFVQEPLFSALAPGGLWWALKWHFRTANTFPKHDMSVADYIVECSGSNRLADVLSAGIHGVWGGDIDTLSAVSVFGWFFHRSAMDRKTNELSVPRRYSEDSFVQEFLSARPHVEQPYKSPTPGMIHFGPYGMESLPKGLASALEGDENISIKKDTRVTCITHLEEQNQVAIEDSNKNTQTYDKVISTLPAQQLASITSPVLTEMENFHSVSIMGVNIYYPTPNLVPPGLGYLIPRSCPPELNPEHALGVFFDSNVIPHQTETEGGTKVFVLLGGHYYDHTAPPTNEQAVAQAKALLHRHLGIDPNEPCLVSANLLSECLPQHYVGHHSLLAYVNDELAENFGGRLAAVGGSFSRPGVMGAMRAGYQIAQKVAQEDFLHTGVEDLVEEKVMNPRYPWPEEEPGH